MLVVFTVAGVDAGPAVVTTGTGVRAGVDAIAVTAGVVGVGVCGVLVVHPAKSAQSLTIQKTIPIDANFNEEDCLFICSSVLSLTYWNDPFKNLI